MHVLVLSLLVFATHHAVAVAPPNTFGPPIPGRAPAGHALGKAAGAIAPVQIEAFFDHICPDSAAAWPALRTVAEQLGPEKVRVVVHIFPLPYHRNAFYAAQGGLVVQHHAGNSESVWFKYLQATFDNQAQLYNDPTHNLTAAQMVDRLATIAGNCCNIAAEDFVQGMQYGNEFDAEARVRWKLGAARGVYGTPTFFVNGVYASSDTWTVDQWIALINSLN